MVTGIDSCTMEFAFDCECGSEIADFMRGDGAEANFLIDCEDCGSVYAVTISQLR